MAGRAPGNGDLPRLATRFIERGSEVADICQLLDDPACQLLTLVGPGGSGKTRLAIEAARCTQGHFPDGVHFVPLAGLSAPEDIAPAIAQALQIHLNGSELPAQQILAYLRPKQMLLLLDNFEHLLEGATFIAAMLEVAPQVKILVTSREALALQEEYLRQVRGMHFPQEGKAEPIEAYSAIQLFVERAAQVSSDFALTREWAPVVRICELVAGLPLGIELAAGWRQTMICEQIVDEIQRTVDFLSSPLRNIPERHRSIRAVFEHSWNLLPPDEQVAFRKLAVFRGDFTVAAAKQVANVDWHILTTLAAKSLVHSSPDGRYDLHELVRQYAAEQLESARERESTFQAHAEYYARFMQQREDRLKSVRRIAAFTEITADWDNVRAASDWALAHRRFDVVDQFIETLFRYGMDARIPETRDFWRRALDALAPRTGEMPHPVWGRLLSRAVYMLGQRGSGAEVWSAELRSGTEKALEIARNQENLAEIGYSLWALAALLFLQADAAGAMPYFEASLPCYQQVGDRFYLGELYHWKGMCHNFLRQKEEAVQCIQQFRKVAREAGNESEEGWALFVLGTFHANWGDAREVEHYMQESRGILQQFGNPIGFSLCDVYLGLFALLRGDAEDAKTRAESALTLARAGNTYSEQRDALVLGGAIRCLEDDYQQGQPLFDEAMALMKNRLGHLQYLLAWGPSLANCGFKDYEAAQENADSLYQWGIMTQSILAPLLALPAQAVVMAHKGFTEYAVELLGLALRYPPSLTGWMQNWPLLTRLRAELEAELGPEIYAAARQRGAKLDLDAVIADLVTQSHLTRSDAAELPMESLSERELEVLRLISAGLSNPEIAQTLVVATGTVKTHVHNICAKLGVRNRLEAVMRAQTLKLV